MANLTVDLFVRYPDGTITKISNVSLQRYPIYYADSTPQEYKEAEKFNQVRWTTENEIKISSGDHQKGKPNWTA